MVNHTEKPEGTFPIISPAVVYVSAMNVHGCSVDGESNGNVPKVLVIVTRKVVIADDKDVVVVNRYAVLNTM